MKTSSLAILAVATFANTAAAESDQGVNDWYGTVVLGSTQQGNIGSRLTNDVGTIDLEFGNSPSYGLTLGRRIGDNWRLEAELSRTSNETSGGTFTTSDSFPVTDVGGGIDVTYAMANLWYDIPAGGQFQPYVGGGIGIGHVKSDLVVFNSDEPGDGGTNLALQVGFGVTMPLNDRFGLDVGYRYKTLPDFEMAGPNANYFYDDASTDSHTLQVGLSMSF